jgi:transposase InsO family protein
LVPNGAGISGEMIRDLMFDCIERRFGVLPAPHRVQCLSDNGSIFAAYKTIDIALALNLEPCFTPVESPESNGMAEAFVKTFKRDMSESDPRRRNGARSDRAPDGGLPFTAGVYQRPV